MSTKILRIQTLCQPNRRYQWCSWPKNRCNLKAASLRTKCVKQRWWYPQFDILGRSTGRNQNDGPQKNLVVTCKASLLFFGFSADFRRHTFAWSRPTKKTRPPYSAESGQIRVDHSLKKTNFFPGPPKRHIPATANGTETPSASGCLYLWLI